MSGKLKPIDHDYIFKHQPMLDPKKWPKRTHVSKPYLFDLQHSPPEPGACQKCEGKGYVMVRFKPGQLKSVKCECKQSE